MNKEVRERLAHDVSLWQADGHIAPKTAAVLRARYRQPGLGWGTVVRYLAVLGALVAGLGLLGLAAAAVGSELLAGLLL